MRDENLRTESTVWLLGDRRRDQRREIAWKILRAATRSRFGSRVHEWNRFAEWKRQRRQILTKIHPTRYAEKKMAALKSSVLRQ